MANSYPIDLVATPQVVPLSASPGPFHNITLAFDTVPSSGTALIEYRNLADPTWKPLTHTNGICINGSFFQARLDGSVAALRITFSGVSDGSGARVIDEQDPETDLSSSKTTHKILASGYEMSDINKKQPVAWVDVYAELGIPVGTKLLIQNKDTQQLIVREQISAPDSSDLSGPICIYGDQYLVTQSPNQGLWIRGRITGASGTVGIICNVQVAP